MTEISIFGHKSALGNFGVKGSLGLMAMCALRQIIHSSSLEQPDSFSKPAATHKSTEWNPQKENTTVTLRPLSTLLSFLQLYTEFLSVWHCSFVQQATVFNLFVGCLSHTLFNSIVSAFLTFLSSHRTVYGLKVYPKISEQTVKIFFFSCLLSRFAFSFLTLAPVFPLPSKHLPANTITESEREKKKTTFLAFSRQWLSKNLHWHTGVDCIVSPMQTRCEALMYGSIFFSSKEDKCRPKM